MTEMDMTITQKLKSISVPVLFNILLPIFDVYSDLRLIILLFVGGFSCRWISEDKIDDYSSCRKDPTIYCFNPNTNHKVCEPVNHPVYATLLLIPFLLSYIMSFITWWRLDTNKKFSFIFAFLNLYAPYGEVLSLI